MRFSSEKYCRWRRIFFRCTESRMGEGKGIPKHGPQQQWSDVDHAFGEFFFSASSRRGQQPIAASYPLHSSTRALLSFPFCAKRHLLSPLADGRVWSSRRPPVLATYWKGRDPSRRDREEKITGIKERTDLLLLFLHPHRKTDYRVPE